MFHFHKVVKVWYLDEIDIFIHVWKIFPAYNSAIIIKINRDFSKLWSHMYCHIFMVDSVCDG